MKKLVTLVVFVCLIFIGQQAQALNTQSLRYYSPGSRALSLVESKPKPKDTAVFGFGFNYALNPLEVGITPGGARSSGVVDHLFTFDAMASYSFTDRIAVSVNVPLHVSRNLVAITGTAMETAVGIGDILVAVQGNIIDPDSNSLNMGLGVLPFVSLPSGKSSDWVGDSNITGGVIVAGDVDLSGHYIGVNMGVRLRQTENFNGLTVGSEFLWDLAYHHVLVPTARLDGFVELNGSTVLKNFWTRANGSPFEARLGLTKALMAEDQLKVTGGAGVGLGSGFGAPDFRGFLKVTYDYNVPHRETTVSEEDLPARIRRIEKELKELTIYYPTDGSQVDPFYDQKIAGIAKILRNNPDLGPLYIVGHTDDVGGLKYNQRLSERRAKGARQSIVDSGLDPMQIVSMGLGESYPVVPNSSDANRALNRRTLFTFVKPSQLQEKVRRSGERVGYNVVTGRRNDSYTEVLKELEEKKSENPSGKTVVVGKYKDNSEVIVEEDGSTQTKDRPGSSPKEVDNKPRVKKFYKDEVTDGGTVIKREKKTRRRSRKKYRTTDDY